MKTKQTSQTFLIAIGMIISACSAPVTTIEPQAGSTTAPTGAATDVTATVEATEGATATVWPPVFDTKSIRDPRTLLESFVVTIFEKSIVSGQVGESTTTIGFINEPYAAYRVNEVEGGDTKIYDIEKRIYELDGIGDWHITLGTSSEPWLKANFPAGIAARLENTQFVAEEEYQGTLAYHFVQEPAAYSEFDYELEGEIYVAKDSNVVLYARWKETNTDGRVYESTQTLSSINQLTELTLPADMEQMPAALGLPQEHGLPLPPDSTIDEMYRSSSGDTQTYFFETANIGRDAFLDFYRDLPTTDGWTVSHVGHVTFHLNDCEFSMECVIISNGSTQAVLAYFGPIRVEWGTHFSPAP